MTIYEKMDEKLSVVPFVPRKGIKNIILLWFYHPIAITDIHRNQIRNKDIYEIIDYCKMQGIQIVPEMPESFVAKIVWLKLTRYINKVGIKPSEEMFLTIKGFYESI